MLFKGKNLENLSEFQFWQFLMEKMAILGIHIWVMLAIIASVFFWLSKVKYAVIACQIESVMMWQGDDVIPVFEKTYSYL